MKLEKRQISSKLQYQPFEHQALRYFDLSLNLTVMNDVALASRICISLLTYITVINACNMCSTGHWPAITNMTKTRNCDSI